MLPIILHTTSQNSKWLEWTFINPYTSNLEHIAQNKDYSFRDSVLSQPFSLRLRSALLAAYEDLLVGDVLT